MDISVMQPYLFPYIGYFQMINCADYFVIGDNYQFIKGGWINRNRILINDTEHMITIPMLKDSAYLGIDKRYLANDPCGRDKILKTIFNTYRRAPHFESCFELVEKILKFSNNNVAEYIHNSLQEVCYYCDIKTPFLIKSELNLPTDLDAQDTIIYICNKLNGDRYINAIGGIELYSAKKFRENGITLKFIKTKESLEYRQFNNKFVPNLSIIDVMMFNSVSEIQKLLTEYDLIDGKN